MLDQKLIRENPKYVEEILSLRGKVFNISALHKLTVEKKEIDNVKGKVMEAVTDKLGGIGDLGGLGGGGLGLPSPSSPTPDAPATIPNLPLGF